MSASASAAATFAGSSSLTAEQIISLAQNPTSTLPSDLPFSSLVFLINSPSLPSLPLLSSLLSLLLRSSTPLPLLSPLFSPLFTRLPSSSLPSLLETLVSNLSCYSDPNTCALLDLLPPLLTLTISSFGISTILPFLDKILASDWPKPFLLKFSSILREFPQGITNHLSPLLEKIFERMNKIDIQDLPSLIYQLLLLASKGVHRRDLIRGILVFFGVKINGPVSIVRQIEGTVLMHVNFAVKQDLSLGQEIITVIQSDFGALNHFMVNVLLSIARVKRFNESVMNVLKLAVVDSKRDCNVSRNCKWLPKCMQEQCLDTAKSIEKSIIKSVNESNGGREHVVPSIVQLGFLILESLDGDSTGDDYFNNKVEIMAIQMLNTLFEIHEMARTEIIEQCKCRILAMKPQQRSPSIRLLGCLIKNYRYTMLGFVSHLKELLDYFAYMHEKTASSLISCILPLIKSSRDLQDYIILVVRKAMFKRDESVRMAATKAITDLICSQNGFGNHLQSNPLLDSSSQASCSQHPEFDFSRSLFHELSGLLRRCLSQQARVKEVLYDGLVKIVESDISIVNIILDFLWPHFLLFYSDDSECPIKMDACFKVENGKICIIEPLDHMLSCINKILILYNNQIKSDRPFNNNNSTSLPCFGFSISQDTESVKSSSIESFSKALSKIKKFVRKCSTEDKQIQSQETGTEMNQMRRLLYLGIIEVFINTTILELEKYKNQENKISSIEKELTELIDSYHFFEKKSSLSKKSKNHFFTTSSIHLLLEASLKLCNNLNYANVTQDRTQNRTQSSKKRDENPKMILFSLNMCFKHIQSSDFSKEDLKKLVKPIMQLVLCLVPGIKQETGTVKKNVKNKSDQLLIALFCLKELGKIMSGDFLKEMVSIALPQTEIEFEIGNLKDDFENKISDLIWVFWEKEINPIFTQLINSSLYAESEALAELILILGKKLASEKRNLLGLYLTKTLKTQKISNPNLSQTLISLATTLIPVPNDLTFSREIGSELLTVIGTGSDDPLLISALLPAVNSSTKDAIARVLIEGVESSIFEFDWVLVKIKELVSGFGSGGKRKVSRVDLEDALYSRLVQVVHLLSIFAEMNLNDSQAEPFLKLNAKFYKLLVRLAKFQIAPKGCKQLFPGLKFQKLAEETCKLLTCQLYSFVALIQWKQDNSVPAKGALKKIKRESKCIPNLIYQIEDYEKYLIKLTKLTKVNFMRYAKRSAARDFKIIITKDMGGDEKVPEQAENSENENENEANNVNDYGGLSESESEKCERLDEKSTLDNGLSTGPGYSDSEREEEVLERRKRVKCNDVQDSDEEG